MKLVRGAYHPHEIEVHKAATASRMEATTPSGTHELSISPDNMPPVWLSKDETDTCYDTSVKALIALIREDVDKCAKGAPGPAIGALFGTHNWDSANLVVDELVKQGLASTDPSGSVWISDAAMQRVAVAQLYGMSDALTDHLVGRTRSTSPFVLKYLPYGSLREVRISRKSAMRVQYSHSVLSRSCHTSAVALSRTSLSSETVELRANAGARLLRSWRGFRANLERDAVRNNPFLGDDSRGFCLV